MTTTTTSDPRGPLRTIETVNVKPSGTDVTYVECDHIGHKNQAMTYKVGAESRCFQCGAAERSAR